MWGHRGAKGKPVNSLSAMRGHGSKRCLAQALILAADPLVAQLLAGRFDLRGVDILTRTPDEEVPEILPVDPSSARPVQLIEPNG